jgi:hypothetical protein
LGGRAVNEGIGLDGRAAKEGIGLGGRAAKEGIGLHGRAAKEGILATGRLFGALVHLSAHRKGAVGASAGTSKARQPPPTQPGRRHGRVAGGRKHAVPPCTPPPPHTHRQLHPPTPTWPRLAAATGASLMAANTRSRGMPNERSMAAYASAQGKGGTRSCSSWICSKYSLLSRSTRVEMACRAGTGGGGCRAGPAASPFDLPTIASHCLAGRKASASGMQQVIPFPFLTPS